jgi:hypothetical protein
MLAELEAEPKLNVRDHDRLLEAQDGSPGS